MAVLGMGPVEGMVVMEELGRGNVLEPLAQSLIAGGVLAGYADAATKAAWLPKIASGEALVVLAYQERAARYKPRSNARQKPRKPLAAM
jgi:alkylation response protein AidB-like acyl-CoA dehydrogenase